MARLSKVEGGGRAKGGVLHASLQLVERGGNILPDPVTIFVALAVLTLIGSWVAAAMGVGVTHPATHERVEAVNLLNRAGIRRVLVNVAPNFIGFKPLGTVLVVMVGIGLAERTGLFAALLKAMVMAAPRGLITPALIFTAIMSNTAADAGFVILPPMAAMLYAGMGRHPLAGVAAVYAGIGGGFSANLLLTALDPLLAGISTEAARLLDPGYEVKASASYFFMAASVPMLTVLGTIVSVKIVEPHIGPWTAGAAQAPEPLERISRDERRGLCWAAVTTLIALTAIVVLVVPKGAPLRDPETGAIKPFYDSLAALLAILFAVPGLTYGLVTRHVKSDRDAAKMMSDTMATMGVYIVLAFFASQFIAYFEWSNLGLIIAISGAEFLRAADFTGLPMLVGFVLITAAINMFMASASAKWVIMAPVFVPMFMLLGWSPETAQGLYRVGDSVTNMITPLNYYLPIVIAVSRRYDPDTGMGTLLAAMLPYSVAFTVAWTTMIMIWIAFAWPLGPGAPLTYIAG